MTKSYKRIDAIIKAAEILEYLSGQKDPAPAKEIARAVGIPYSTVMCHLASLHDVGFVRGQGDCYTLGLGLAKFWARVKSREEANLLESKRILSALNTGESL